MQKKQKADPLRDFIPWENIGMFWRNPDMPIFYILGSVNCFDEVSTDENGSILF